MRKAALHNLGCKVNAYETGAMQQLLEEAGYEIVPFHERADVYVVNTCSVTNIADRKSRQMLHRARRQNPDSVIVAAGCYVQTAGRKLSEEGLVDILIGNNKKAELLSLLDEFLQDRAAIAKCQDINAGHPDYEELRMTKTAGHTRAFVKVQDGYNQFCSYCVIPYARGRARSRGLEDVLAEIRALAAGGCQEVVLTGIHLSSYGIDSGDSLLHLIREVHALDGITRIRLGSLEPSVVTEEFAGTLAGLDKVCPHFHLSLQSGCDATLKRMNRRYDTAEYARRCEMLRAYFDHPAITTDVIAGFPGETEEEFAATKSYLERIHFYELHVFKYSGRNGTRAAAMEHQVPEPVKAKRSAELIALGRRMSAEYRQQLVGQETTVLMEEPVEYEGKRYVTGFTREYVKMAVRTKKQLSNTLVRGRIAGPLTEDMYLMVEI